MKVIPVKRSILWIVCIATLCLLGYTALRLLMFNPYFLDFTTVSSKIFDRNGEMLWEISEDNAVRNTPIDIKTLPRGCVDGVVAIEDKTFWINNGVDDKGLARLAVSVLTGTPGGGGSTISQQLIKNAYLNMYNRDPLDKYFEILFAIKMNMFFPKEKILEQYLNNIYFGELNYGIESASLSYFGKSATELNTSECAYLVGIPQWPGIYNPYAKPEKGLERKDQILDAMLEQGFLSQDEFNQAKSFEIQFKLLPSTIKAPHFVQFVGENLSKTLGKEVYNSHKIYTTYDYKLHQNVLSILKDYVNASNDKNINNSAAVIFDNEGNLLTMVGSIGFFNDEIEGKFNSALGLRQPGTLYIPWLYSLALDNGYTLDSEFQNKSFEIDIDGNPKNVNNIDGSSSSFETLKNSLYKVIPATHLAQEIGIDKIKSELSLSLNYSPGDLNCDLTMVQEGCEISLLDLTSLYAGNFNSIIESNYLTSIDGFASDLGKQSLQKYSQNNQVKELMDQSDSGWVYIYGAVSNKKDLFAIAFNQNYTVGVWSGNTKGEELKIDSSERNILPLNQIINSLNQ